MNTTMSSSFLANSVSPSRNYINQNPKFSYPKTLNPLKTHFLNLPSFRCCSHQPQQPIEELYVPLKPRSEPSVSKFRVEKIATLLLGSLILLGYLKPRPVLAQLPQETVSIEEKTNADIESGEDEEEVMCVKLLQGDPKNIDALKMVVNAKMRRGKTKEAVEYVERLIKLQPNEMEWRLLQALCYEMTGNLSKAKSLFKNILEQKPLLLRALHLLHRIPTGEKFISGALLRSRGLAMVMHKKLEGPAVFEMLERALEFARNERRVNEERSIRILIAQMHVVKGELEAALSKFGALIDENPRDFRPYLCQGIVYGLLGKGKEADESFELYRSLVPEEFPQRAFLDDVFLSARREAKLSSSMF